MRRPLAAAVVVVGAVAIVLLPAGWAVAPTAVLLAMALRLPADDRYRSTVLAALAWGAVGLASVLSFGLVWPIPPAIGLLAAAALLRSQGWQPPEWLASGRPDRTAWWLAVTSVPLTTVAVASFIASGRTDLETATDGLEPFPVWSLPIIGLAFVLVNPTVEEALFRGALQTMVADATSRPVVGIAVSAVAFGAIHLDGVPGGPLGVLMAAGWGAMLGVVRQRTGSIRLAWFVHVLANVAIYTTVVVLAVEDGVL